MANEPAISPDFEKFTWRIEDFSKKNLMELRSKTFKIRGYAWYVLENEFTSIKILFVLR